MLIQTAVWTVKQLNVKLKLAIFEVENNGLEIESSSVILSSLVCNFELSLLVGSFLYIFPIFLWPIRIFFYQSFEGAG